MPTSAYPIGSDLQNFLEGAGLVPSPISGTSTLLDFNGAIWSAITDWERDTHWEPFLADSSDQTVLFSPNELMSSPNELPYLPLDGGFISITSIRTGVTATSTGTLLTANTDYWLKPDRAAAKNKPYTYIEFNNVTGSIYTIYWQPQSIQIIGKRGYCSTVADDVNSAILNHASFLLSSQIQAGLSKGLISWKESDGTSEVYSERGNNPVINILKSGEDYYNKSVKRYRRLIV